VDGKKEGCVVTYVVQRKGERLPRRTSLLMTWLADLRMLGSLFLARFMVWRELRRERKEKV